MPEVSVLYLVSGVRCGLELLPSQYQVNAACQEGATRSHVHWDDLHPCCAARAPRPWCPWLVILVTPLVLLIRNTGN